MDAITSGASSDCENQIAGLYGFLAPILWNQSDIATEDKWITRKS
jgi:hypothetical protein